MERNNIGLRTLMSVMMEKLDSSKLKEIFSEVSHKMPMPPELAVENKEKKSKGKSK